MPDLFLGLDIGTSGVRAIAIDEKRLVHAEGKSEMSGDFRAPDMWWRAAENAIKIVFEQIDPRNVRALSVDGTSGTMLALDRAGNPIGSGIMYNDPCHDIEILACIKQIAPADSAALGSNSALARAIGLQDARPAKIVHQADWVASYFSGIHTSDENNALKTGYDLHERRWPDWINDAGMDRSLFPEVFAPGTAVGTICQSAQSAFGLSSDTVVVAGTTDGCASFVATGADQPGEGVTALGTTMTIKLLSDRPISAPEYGIYSHRILGHWLAGGASNTGGKVLLHYFKQEELIKLSEQIDPSDPSPFAYYPLSEPGERFPVSDPNLQPILEPRPIEDADFLKDSSVSKVS